MSEWTLRNEFNLVLKLIEWMSFLSTIQMQLYGLVCIEHFTMCKLDSLERNPYKHMQCFVWQINKVLHIWWMCISKWNMLKHYWYMQQLSLSQHNQLDSVFCSTVSSEFTNQMRKRTVRFRKEILSSNTLLGIIIKQMQIIEQSDRSKHTCPLWRRKLCCQSGSLPSTLQLLSK